MGAEFAPSPLVYLLAVVATTAFVFARFRQTAWRLLRRSRWLFLVLLLTYAYTVPGHLLLPLLGGWSPATEGIQQAMLRIFRLALIIVGLAVLLAGTERGRLIYGLYILTRPLQLFGFDRRAFAVRLGLTLESVDMAVPGRQWLEALSHSDSLPDTPTTYRLDGERWQWLDGVFVLTGLFLLWAVLR